MSCRGFSRSARSGGQRESFWPLACLCDLRSRVMAQGRVGRTTALSRCRPLCRLRVARLRWAPGCPRSGQNPPAPWAVAELGSGRAGCRSPSRLRQLLALDLSRKALSSKGSPGQMGSSWSSHSQPGMSTLLSMGLMGTVPGAGSGHVNPTPGAHGVRASRLYFSCGSCHCPWSAASAPVSPPPPAWPPGSSRSPAPPGITGP